MDGHIQDYSNFNRPSHAIPEEQVVLDKAPIPFDWKQHHTRFRRSHRGCDIGARYVLFVMDTSGSIGATDFERMKVALSSLSKLFCGDAKIAVITFGHVLHVDFCFDCVGWDKYLAAEAFQHIKYRHGWSTRTGSAAQCVCDVMLNEQCGLPTTESCIDVIFITDGHSNAGLDICETVQCIHNYTNSRGDKTIVTHAIGIGNHINENELNCIADNSGLTHLHPYLKEKYLDFRDFETGIQEVADRIIADIINGTNLC